MISTSIAQKTNQPLKLRERFVEALKIGLVIKPLQIRYSSYATKRLALMKTMPVGSAGHDLYKMLNENQLKPIPKFEEHDLKHLILGYGMSSIDEIKMQAYLFGNGNHSIFCLLFLASGVLFPKEWSSFYADYKKGKTAPSVLHLDIDACMHEKTDALQATFK